LDIHSPRGWCDRYFIRTRLLSTIRVGLTTRYYYWASAPYGWVSLSRAAVSSALASLIIIGI
jgi:hypothetical protein